MKSEIRLIETIDVSNTLGESILWNHQDQSAWWTDIESSKLYRYDFESKSLKQWSLPERLGSFGFVENYDNWLIAAFETGFALYAPESGKIKWLARPEQGIKFNRLNDGRVDRQGRFWAGSMVEKRDLPIENMAGLYLLLNDGSFRKMEDNILISNSICFSLDSSTVYYADSPKNVIYCYDFDPLQAALSNRRIFAKTKEFINPDGSTIDSENHLWNAQWGAGQVVRYNPDGKIDLIIDIPTANPTCVAFGGKDMNLLFVTSATQGLSDEEKKSKSAGALLIYETPFKGVKEVSYKFKGNI